MIFCKSDFVDTTEPRHTSMVNANRVAYPIIGARKVTLSPTLSWLNTLLVSSFSNKLMLVEQVTEEMNCVSLMYPTFYIFQDILTKEIIGHGTKKERLYYMNDFSSCRVNNVCHSFNAKEKPIWLWHYRLGHPLFGYMKHLFPQLFLNLNCLDFKCYTCILVKSHRVPFPISSNKSNIPSTLIHYDV